MKEQDMFLPHHISSMAFSTRSIMTHVSLVVLLPVWLLGRAPDADDYLREYFEGVRVIGVTHASVH